MSSIEIGDLVTPNNNETIILYDVPYIIFPRSHSVPTGIVVPEDVCIVINEDEPKCAVRIISAEGSVGWCQRELILTLARINVNG